MIKNIPEIIYDEGDLDYETLINFPRIIVKKNLSRFNLKCLYIAIFLQWIFLRR